MGWGAVEGLHRSQQPLAGRHGGWKADVFRVQRLVLVIFQLHEGGHQPGREIEIGHVGDQAGVIVVDVGRALSPHVWGLPVEAVGGRAEVGVLGSSPGRVLVDTRMRHAMARVVVRGAHFGREVPLGVVEAVGIGRPLEGVPRREVVLHEAGREAVEVVGVWRLVELRVLLVGREGPPEVWGPLHAEGRLALAPAPGRLLVLAVPGALELAVPGRVRLVVPGRVALAVPARVTTLLAPHAFVAVVPGGAVGWAALVVRVGRLLWRLLLAPRSHGVRLVKPRGLVRWDLVVRPRAPGASGCGILDPSWGFVL